MTDSSSTRRRIWAVAALGSVVVVVLLLAGGFRSDPTVVRSPLVGRAAPVFELPTLEGNGRFSLAGTLAQGRPVVVNFWATWCVECRREHPMMVRVWERYRSSEVVMVGIVFQDDPEAARGYIRDLGGTWPNLVDEGSRVALRFGVYGVPETYFIRPDGTIAGRQIGGMSEEQFIAGIEAIRVKPGARAP